MSFKEETQELWSILPLKFCSLRTTLRVTKWGVGENAPAGFFVVAVAPVTSCLPLSFALFSFSLLVQKEERVPIHHHTTKRGYAGDYGTRLHVQKLCGPRNVARRRNGQDGVENLNPTQWNPVCVDFHLQPQVISAHTKARELLCLAKLHTRRNFNGHNFSYLCICAGAMAHATVFSSVYPLRPWKLCRGKKVYLAVGHKFSLLNSLMIEDKKYQKKIK